MANSSGMRLIVGNWKMNLTSAGGASLVQAIIGTAERSPKAEVAVCPSFPLLSGIADLVKGSSVALGAQNVFWKEGGAYTGQVSPGMLVDSGCKYCIVGHSEARGRFGSSEMSAGHPDAFADSDSVVNSKLKALLFAGIKPILCVGETESERGTGKTDDVVADQLSAALSGIAAEECESLTVAYEPVWAIGTGNACSASEAARMCRFISESLSGILGFGSAGVVRVLYGGSVKGDNVSELFEHREILGVLVGGASLDADEFSRIILAA